MTDLRYILRNATRDGVTAGPGARLYTRYRIGDVAESTQAFGVVTLGSGARHALLDLSYGGLSISPTELEPTSAVAPLSAGSLLSVTILGETLTADATGLYETDRMLGYAFDHAQSDVLAYLQRILPYLAVGSGLFDVSEDDEDDLDGLTDDEGENGGLCGALFLAGNNVELRFNDGRVETAVSYDGTRCVTSQGIGVGGELGEVAPTRRADSLILRKAALVMRGLAQVGGTSPRVAEAARVACEHWRRAARAAREAGFSTAI